MSSKEEKAKAYIKPIILDRNKNLNNNNWELGSDYLDFTGYEVQCAFEAGWDAAINKACECHGVLVGNLQLIVKEDAGGYPYIPIIELYDYEKDIPLAKVGDKVKVLIFKEE